MTVVANVTPKATVSALSVDEVSHAYGARVALDEVSFDIAPASFTVLLGLNGAGKSTLFSVITHLYVSRSGAVRIFGRDVARDSGAALALLGVVFQQRTLDPDLSVAQNLAYHGALHGIGRRETRARQAIQLARVGLADRAGDKVRFLSGGQMRRVEIARALLHRPHMLLLDEPTAGLDIKARAGILEVVRGLVADEANRRPVGDPSGRRDSRRRSCGRAASGARAGQWPLPFRRRRRGRVFDRRGVLRH